MPYKQNNSIVEPHAVSWDKLPSSHFIWDLPMLRCISGWSLQLRSHRYNPEMQEFDSYLLTSGNNTCLLFYSRVFSFPFFFCHSDLQLGLLSFFFFLFLTLQRLVKLQSLALLTVFIYFFKKVNLHWIAMTPLSCIASLFKISGHHGLVWSCLPAWSKES